MKRFLTKATEHESGPPRRSQNWVVARRGWFKVFDDRVECGDWTIPLESVDRAILYASRWWLVMKVRVLELHAGGKTYQFGFNPWAHPERHLNLELERQSVRIGYSPFSVLVRVVLVGYLVWQAWQWLQ